MSGRGISEQILMAKETVHILNRKCRGGQVMIKLDMTKAFDHVYW